MVKRNFICLSLIILFSVSLNSALASVSSQLCSSTTNICVSNITNDLTVKDEALLEACKDCCAHAGDNAPASVKKIYRGCIPRCKTSCTKAYKKEIKKLN